MKKNRIKNLRMGTSGIVILRIVSVVVEIPGSEKKKFVKMEINSNAEL